MTSTYASWWEDAKAWAGDAWEAATERLSAAIVADPVAAQVAATKALGELARVRSALQRARAAASTLKGAARTDADARVAELDRRYMALAGPALHDAKRDDGSPVEMGVGILPVVIAAAGVIVTVPSVAWMIDSAADRDVLVQDTEAYLRMLERCADMVEQGIQPPDQLCTPRQPPDRTNGVSVDVDSLVPLLGFAAVVGLGVGTVWLLRSRS